MRPTFTNKITKNTVRWNMRFLMHEAHFCIVSVCIMKLRVVATFEWIQWRTFQYKWEKLS